MSLPPRISIVTPSYNQAPYLEECIDSVLSQGYPNLEYVVMDGGSNDGSVEIIKKYEKHLTYWQSCQDGGHYAAINTGFSKTSGEIMAWLNSDDRYHPNAFLKVACAFSEHPEVNWLTGRRTVFNEDGTLQGMDRFYPQYSIKKMLSGYFDTPCIMQETTFWRRLLWEKAGGHLDLAYKLAADTELWLRFFRTDFLHTLDALLGGFRKQAGNRSVQHGESYLREVQIALSCERDCAHNTATTPSPTPVKIEASRLIEFAESHKTPLFKPNPGQLWQNYLQTISEWIVERKGGLEAVSIFLNEINLWQDSEAFEKQAHVDYLQHCLALQQKAEQLIYKGEILFLQNDIDGALKSTFEAVDICPTSADGNNNLGVLLYHKGKIKEAIKYLMLVIQHDISKNEAYRNLALIFYELGQRDKAQSALDDYRAWFPEDNDMKQFYRRLMECP